jgi:hypothetical protein
MYLLPVLGSLILMIVVPKCISCIYSEERLLSVLLCCESVMINQGNKILEKSFGVSSLVCNMMFAAESLLAGTEQQGKATVMKATGRAPVPVAVPVPVRAAGPEVHQTTTDKVPSESASTCSIGLLLAGLDC